MFHLLPSPLRLLRLVKEDIISKLELKIPQVFQKSFARDNLSFVVRKTETKEKKLLEVLRKVVEQPSYMCAHARHGDTGKVFREKWNLRYITIMPD